jgi:hypothetical protein
MGVIFYQMVIDFPPPFSGLQVLSYFSPVVSNGFNVFMPVVANLMT